MITDLRKTAIVCTIGPSSEDLMEDLFKAGMNVARINFSHGGKEENKTKVEKFKEIRNRLNIPASLMLDTQGPEIRTGILDDEYVDGVELKEGDQFTLKSDGSKTDNIHACISYKGLSNDVQVGNKILIDDGALELEVQRIEDGDIHCVIINGGILKSRKSVNIPGVYLNNPTLSPKDIEDLIYATEEEFDFVAASFIRNKEDVLEIRKVLDEHGGQEIEIIAKIENRQSLEHIDEIIETADGVMVARGDLAVEIPFVEVPIWQKKIISKCNSVGKPVIVATQMLESMMHNPTPTRAEASDVANAVYDKASAVMLSGETAVGKYPIKCVETMASICKKVEASLHYWGRIKCLTPSRTNIEDDSVVLITSMAKSISADLMVTYTHTGKSVKKLSGGGVACPIFAVTDNWKTFNKLILVWNVFPMYMEKEEVIDNMMEKVIAKLREQQVIEEGDIILLSGGKNYINGVSESKRIGGIAIV